ELMRDGEGRIPFDAALNVGARVEAAAKHHGLLLRVVGDRLVFAPPLVIETGEIEDVSARLERALDDVAAVLGREGAVRCALTRRDARREKAPAIDGSGSCQGESAIYRAGLLVTNWGNAMKLYEFAPTRSIRVRWTLQELGVDFETITVDLLAGEHRSPAFLKINPAGKLPVLVDGDMVLTESVAIVLYLAEKYRDKGLIPLDLQQRAQMIRWLLFTTTELEQPLWRIARHTTLYPEN